MKWALGLLVFLSLNGFAAVPAWYNEEIIHNTVHDLEERFETPRVFVFHPEDSERFRKAFFELKNAVTHVHDQLEDQKGWEAVVEAMAKMERPIRKFRVIARENQLNSKTHNLHFYDVLNILYIYEDLKYLLTPVNSKHLTSVER